MIDLNLQNTIQRSFRSARETLDALELRRDVFDGLEKGAAICSQAMTCGKKIMLCGNGGSAADAQHIAAELVGRFSRARPGLAALALTTDSSALTAIGNDFGFDFVFSRQIEALGMSGDILIVITTSGESRNILAAMRAAKAANIKTILLTGDSTSSAEKLGSDVLIKVPSLNTPRIQEAHILIGHTLCELIERILFGGKP